MLPDANLIDLLTGVRRPCGAISWSQGPAFSVIGEEWRKRQECEWGSVKQSDSKKEEREASVFRKEEKAGRRKRGRIGGEKNQTNTERNLPRRSL